MPVAAREASVYTGITIAEYYRDMGYDVSLMADSTSRWAEAMREISSRLEEMPGEEGYPAYLASRLSEFYERCGRVKTLAGPTGSISVIGAVSPSGGDFSEPVTQNTLRIVKVFWALDSKLRERRHFPAVNWLTSYSLYSPMLEEWYRKNVAEDWNAVRLWAMETLQKEAELQEIVQLVGSDALPEEQRLTLEVARMIREFFLQQSAYHPVDTYSPLKRQYEYMNAIKRFSELSKKAISLEVPLDRIASLPVRAELGKLKFEESIDRDLKTIVATMDKQFSELGV
jgi:V/A-type H+-transporting ATPase subunit A